jgi:hypothetical protein
MTRSRFIWRTLSEAGSRDMGARNIPAAARPPVNA